MQTSEDGHKLWRQKMQRKIEKLSERTRMQNECKTNDFTICKIIIASVWFIVIRMQLMQLLNMFGKSGNSLA